MTMYKLGAIFFKLALNLDEYNFVKTTCWASHCEFYNSDLPAYI